MNHNRSPEHCLEVHGEFINSCKDPSGTNTKTLFRIISDNADSEFGRKHHFSDISSIEDFKKYVPLSTFDEYADLVYREIIEGEKNLMTSYEVVAYNKTSGTSGSVKKIPMTDVGMRDLLDGTCGYVNGLAISKLGDSAKTGKGLWLTEATSCAFADNGVLCTGLSGHLTLNWHIPYGNVFTSPIEASKPEPGTNTRYLHARFGLSEKNISNIACTFASFILDLFRYIEKNWEMLCDDIENGTIDQSIQLLESDRISLESRIKPMPERAEELRQIFRKGFDKSIANKIWPNLAYINCVCTGVFSSYMTLLKDGYIGDLPIIPFGLTASEGVMTVAYDLNTTDTIPITSRMYYEFLPLDSDNEETVGIDEVELGKDYEVIITTSSGLYRYRTRDAVRVHGFYENMPTFDYLYRIDMCVSLNGEKTYEPALREAMDLTSRKMGFKCLDFCVYPNFDEARPFYEFFIEMIDYSEDMSMDELALCLEDNLKEVNSLMKHQVYTEYCDPVKVHLIQEETYQLYHDKMVMRGGSSTQVKPVKIIINMAQLRFFRILLKDNE